LPDTPEQPTELRVLFLKEYNSDFEDLVATFRDVLDQQYYADVTVLTDPLRLSPTYYSLLPHFIVFDSQYQAMVDKIADGENVPNELSGVPVCLLQDQDGETRAERDAGLTVQERLRPGAGRERIQDIVESFINQLGFDVKDGKIHQRLVKRPLDVEVDVADVDITLEGETTGINRNGLGARVSLRAPDGNMDDLAGHGCAVRFNEMDLGFVPAEGRILRVEDSWDDVHDAFVAVRFDPNIGLANDPNSLSILEDLIESQQDESLRKHGEGQSES
jgi:hypothetical protein